MRVRGSKLSLVSRRCSEWAHAVLLRLPPTGEPVLLAELLALRAILLNLHFAVCGGAVTVEHASADKRRSDKVNARRPSRRGLRRTLGQEWGRADAGTWPGRNPSGLGLTLVAMVIGRDRVVSYATTWTPLQRLYCRRISRSEIASALAIKTGRYRVLSVVHPKGNRLALDEVQP